ncbi:MAG: hypothetical protein IPJ69_03140 [Deltaproteobacteria bacterium]|nr:MAG: hypothetical protein IPJ69_03140 [Deltaproteobacteria bacterium]
MILDFDTHNETNGFYYIKRIFNEESFRRFCIFPHIEKYWDKRLEINNVQYIPIPFKIDESDSLRELRSDFSILITTWCRLRYILDYLKPITFFLKYLDPQEPIKDFQYLFQALSFLLQKETHIPLAKKMRLFTYISEIYYHTNSLLKIEIIDQLKTKRKVLLYGDEDWKIFFPNYYQGF